MEARLRIRGQLEAGVQSLNRANAAQRNMADAYRDLESEHSKAMLLLGAAGVGAVAALGLVAGSCAAAAAKATAAFEFWSASHMSMMGPSLMSDYLVLNGAAPQAVAAGVRALGTSAARNYAAAKVAGTGAAASVGYVEWFRQKFNSGLTETKAAMDQALQLRNGLERVCREKERELNRLQDEMNGVRDRLRACPDVEILFLPEHAEEPIYIESNWASRGGIRA